MRVSVCLSVCVRACARLCVCLAAHRCCSGVADANGKVGQNGQRPVLEPLTI